MVATRRGFAAAVAIAVACWARSALAADGAAEPAAGPPPPAFELVFGGAAWLRSFVYFEQGDDNWIDTVIDVQFDLVRYRRAFFYLGYEQETDMGHGSQPGMPFDPNRGRWILEAGARLELGQHFLAAYLHHDCYHGIDRWIAGQDFKMTAEGLSFGTLRYLEQHRFDARDDGAEGLSAPLELHYLLAPSVYLPNGESWQRSPYAGRLEANLRLALARWWRLDLVVESQNVLYLTRRTTVERLHAAQGELLLRGTRHGLSAFVVWWFHDDQIFRNRSGRAAAGLKLSL